MPPAARPPAQTTPASTNSKPGRQPEPVDKHPLTLVVTRVRPLGAFGVDTLRAGDGAVERLTRLVNDEPTVENWAPRAPAVFAAAEDGSGLAMTVIEAAAELAGLVRRLRTGGAAGTAVVAGGSVVTRQPLLARALEARLRRVDAELELRVLAEEPVAGAMVLARRRLGSSLTK